MTIREFTCSSIPSSRPVVVSFIVGSRFRKGGANVSCASRLVIPAGELRRKVQSVSGEWRVNPHSYIKIEDRGS